MKVQIGHGPDVYGEVEAVDDELRYTGEHTDVLERLLLSMWRNKEPDAPEFVASLPKRLTGRIWAKAVNDEEKQ